MFFLASSNSKSTIYKSTNPLAGEWGVAVESLEIPVWDPAFFLDDDNKLYLYWGCSDRNPIYGVEVDYRNNFSFIGKPRELIFAKPAENGWEVPGDYNTHSNRKPWIEGAWMNKFNGKYYLQYASPGTEYKSYNDGVYVANSPLGPFGLQPHNPFAYKPEGFAAGAGHGSTFTDRYGNLWHIGTITISQKHVFERRLALYPAFIDKNGTLYSTTKFGDYPLVVPSRKVTNFSELFPGWMLLSYGKRVEVSSAIDSLPASNIVDENIRTYWAATSGSANEFALLDLGKTCNVCAVQVNFAEHSASILGRPKNIHHRYTIESSNDKVRWRILVDKSKSCMDNSHNYIQLAEVVPSRYLRIRNVEVPSGHFAISGLRVFGKGDGVAPAAVKNMVVTRNRIDRRSVTIAWERSDNATGYNINFGVDWNMYNNYLVYRDTSVVINSLNASLSYYFSVEPFNENGVSADNVVIYAE